MIHPILHRTDSLWTIYCSRRIAGCLSFGIKKLIAQTKKKPIKDEWFQLQSDKFANQDQKKTSNMTSPKRATEISKTQYMSSPKLKNCTRINVSGPFRKPKQFTHTQYVFRKLNIVMNIWYNWTFPPSSCQYIGTRQDTASQWKAPARSELDESRVGQLPRDKVWCEETSSSTSTERTPLGLLPAQSSISWGSQRRSNCASLDHRQSQTKARQDRTLEINLVCQPSQTPWVVIKVRILRSWMIMSKLFWIIMKIGRQPNQQQNPTPNPRTI